MVMIPSMSYGSGILLWMKKPIVTEGLTTWNETQKQEFVIKFRDMGSS